MREIEIAGRMVGDGHPPFIVAEAAINHNGKLKLALEMVEVAKDAGCDAFKVGVFRAAEFCSRMDPLYSVFKRCELELDDWETIKAKCDDLGLIFFGTPQNRSDLDVLLKIGVPCIKVGSDDMTNTALIMDYATERLPMILSTGMADQAEVRTAVNALPHGHPLIVCVCTSMYPCPALHANLKRITTLRNMMPQTVIGFSDHTRGARAAAVAVALGASYFEKHFTLDRCLDGPDHEFSAAPETLARWVQTINHAVTVLGDGQIRPTGDELQNRAKWRRKSGQRIRGITS